ncbi:YraN family protein [Allomuricauda sp. SCSIO 65647]|uniref:YraN family protein n=1 Tax=Allomuricauda sp. SCSIO 65647 TaxID=2908843 RepID=UPI001F481279|nr:YraN family protein [Muricauda sp. SCSIO 65647]UJH68710.1 YraN family protein [Muricauda sp. SCSIO 65647]
MGKHNEFGKLGEQLAVDFLIRNGYQILRRNYRYLKGELDIVAKKDAVLSIVEVKSRSSDFIETIAETVNQKKIKLIVATADAFVTENNREEEVRFDIITILKKGTEYELEHIEDAFYHF